MVETSPMWKDEEGNRSAGEGRELILSLVKIGRK
jgi:hypothetical protein